MRQEYKNILEEMVNNDVIVEHIDGRNLLSNLRSHDVLSWNEQETLQKMLGIDSIRHLMKVVLKTKNDEALIKFLNSLKEAKYDDAYSLLKRRLDNLNLGKSDKIDPGKLNNLDLGKLDNPDSTLLWKSGQTDITLKTAWDNLKVHYKERLHVVESYWRQFGVKGILNMDSFYNHNIVISNEKYNQIQKKIENFDDMFSTGYKRIIVMAETGCGKSAFVQEMTRQWVEGDKHWTRKFAFLFLFCLTEVDENESKSLENLLTACLCSHDASIVYNWLKCGNVSKTLFIFDGLDELRQSFCQEVSEIIFGGKVNLATVVITSRECEKLTDLEKDIQPKLYIELKGYTKEGVIQQLEKFSIPVDGMKKALKNHLKIPLFNTIFCITHSESSFVCLNTCSSIHRFVNYAINRYRTHNQSFIRSCEEELLSTLGQAAQNKFSFVQDVEIPYSNVSRSHLIWAIKSGLLHNNSQIEDLVFAHQTIAEYCAAYFWCKKKRLTIKECYCGKVLLIEPPNAQIEYYVEPFSQFVCLLSPEFKEDLWLKFGNAKMGTIVPVFDEYENLPHILHTKRRLHFSTHSVNDQITIMNKLRFQEHSELILINGRFEREKLFKTIRKLKKLYLVCCTFTVTAEEFFIHLTNVQSLIFQGCQFYDLNMVYDDPDSDESNSPHPPHLPLQKLEIRNCSGTIGLFLSFIMKHSIFMKSFELHTHSFYNLREKYACLGEEKPSKNISVENDVDDCGIGWISELQNNNCLCISIENCMLSFAYPFTLIPIIETFKIMQNLKQLNLRVFCKLTKLETKALADLLEVGLFVLEHIDLNIEMENQEDYEPILKNLTKLSALTSLHLWNESFTIDTLNYLVDIFNKLKLKECELEYQEIFFEEQVINSINSCLSLKNITFCNKKMKCSNSELFKKRIENEDRQLKIIKRSLLDAVCQIHMKTVHNRPSCSKDTKYRFSKFTNGVTQNPAP